jgi:ABC-type dipeptide/oligopeptide/nickel transport system permease component
MGSIVVGSLLFIIGIILSDILYVMLDPRIRLK